MDDKIKTAQKSLGVQSQQWNIYQETLLQTINWLESVEKAIASNQTSIWSSPQEIRSKLLKQKVHRNKIWQYKIIRHSIQFPNILITIHFFFVRLQCRK